MVDNKQIQQIQNLSYAVYKRKGSEPFLIEELVNIPPSTQKLIDFLISDGFFFLKKEDNGLYRKTYRIPEICNRTINELKKEKINKKILKILTNYPLLLHTEFERWLNTKHKSMISYILDKYWHNFMLYSYEYNSWCLDNFGYIIHHVPTPDYENISFKDTDIIKDHVDYFKEYRKIYPITKSILLYNMPYKMVDANIKFKEIKKVIFDLISELSLEPIHKSKIDKNKILMYRKIVQDELEEKGYSIIRNKLNLTECHLLNRELGTIINITNITINRKSDKKFNSHRMMPLHTDAHDVNIISWFCQEQDSEDGRMILQSLRNYKQFFSSDEIVQLKKIKIKYPIYKRFYTGLHPLLKKGNFYYAPWLEDTESSREYKKIFTLFKTFLADKKKIFITLEKGDILYLDNLSIIHGRDEISKNSKRLLYRTHIMT